ncbi:hypothetical protein CJ030_MR7G017764 [Morella rubra]|uniref:Uncharacterized protein n=1 Tax=Morella rubra TaxID=262757 RepID=A0A6A1UYY3_9ROSI|nr:hypothetical protein CJ030_MR7G017764 [Morella rubra]
MEKNNFWQELWQLNQNDNMPWICLGDVNDIGRPDETQLFVAAGIRFYSSGWISSKTSIGQVLVEFYKALFTTSALAIPKDMENLIEPNSTLQDNEMLTSTPNAHEIFATLQKIHPEQAPNPDEVLCRLLIREESAEHLKGIKVACEAPSISHFLFADDFLLSATVPILDQLCLKKLPTKAKHLGLPLIIPQAKVGVAAEMKVKFL